MAFEAAKLEMVKDNIIRVFHPRVLTPATYLTAEVAAAGTTLTVANNDGVLDNDPVLFEGFGQPLAEIKDVTASPTYGTSIAVSAVTFAHPINTGIFRLPFDQIELSGTNTTGGSKTVIATVDINPTAPYTEYLITGTTYSFYYARYKNSFATTPYFGAYSDEVASTDLGVRTVGTIRRMAFDNLNVKFSGIFNADWVYDQIFQCEVDVLKEKEVWGEMVVYDTKLGTISTGMPSVALPSNIDLTKTNRGVLGLRISTGQNLDFLDWKRFQDEMQGVSYTTLASTASIGATTLVLTDSSDFDDSGSVTIGSSTLAYTANNRSTNTLSGLTALSAQISSGAHVWQGVAFGEPTMFSVNNGSIYFDVPFSSDFVDRPIWIDFFKTAVRPNSDGDEVSFSNPLLYIKYLEAQIKKKKGNGELSLQDDSFLKYEQLKRNFALRDKSPYSSRMVPMAPFIPEDVF